MEYGVSIAGCPYFFTTYGVSSSANNVDSDAAWSDDWTYARGYLDWTKPPRWSERCDPLEGELSVSQIAFTLHDAEISTGPAAGYPLLTWLTTRLPNQITRTNLATTIDDNDLSIVSTTSTGISTGAQIIWIDGEAIECSGFDAGTKTFTVTGRGYYGSRAVAHTVDASRSVAPVIWTSFPWVRRRKVALWSIDDSGNARRLWTGVCGRAPRLVASRGSGVASPQIELQCDSLAATLRDLPLGLPDATCRVRGWDRSAIGAGIASGTAQAILQYARGSISLVHNTLGEAVAAANLDLKGLCDNATLTRDAVDLSASGRGVRLKVVLSTGTDPIGMYLTVGAKTAAAGRAETSGTRAATVAIDEAPTTLARAFRDLEGAVAVDNTLGLPASWAATSDPHDGITTTAAVILRGELEDGVHLHLTPSATSTTPPAVTARAALDPPDATLSVTPAIPNPDEILITKPVELATTTHVSSQHWLHALRYGVIADLAGSLGALLDDGDWEWSQMARAVRLTTSTLAARDWYLDGQTRLGAILGDAIKLHGCGLGIRSGRIAPFAFQPPINTDSAVATFSAATDLLGPVQWSAFPDGLANVVQIDGELVKASIAVRSSIDKYTIGRTIKVSLAGVAREGVIASTPSELISGALSRMVGLWSEPTALMSFEVSLASLFDTPVAIGDYISVTDWLAPNGTGTRGITSRTVQVIGREVDLSTGIVRLECLDWYRFGLVGWSPAARVTGIAGAVLTCGLDYVGQSSTTDYAGSDQTGYGGTANDGGVSKFAAGYKVLLRRWDTTTATELAAEVLSVNPGARTITLTAAPGATWEGYASGGIVDVVFDDYGTVTAAQKLLGGWVSSKTNGVVGASSDAPNNWSA